MTDNVLCTEKTLLGTEFYAKELESTTFNSQERTIKIYYKTLCETINTVEVLRFQKTKNAELVNKIIQTSINKYVKTFNMGYEECLLK